MKERKSIKIMRFGFVMVLGLLYSMMSCTKDPDSQFENNPEVTNTSISIVADVTNISINNTTMLDFEIESDNMTNPTIIWSSDNPAIATIDQNGLVQAHGVGTVQITAALEGSNTIIDTIEFTVNNGAFITTWDGTTTVSIPMNPDFSYDYEVDWGDGTTNQVTNQDATSGPNNTLTFSHTFADQGPHTVSITGQFPAIRFSSTTPGVENITQVNQWGSIAWESMERAFELCINLTFPATDVPDLSGVTNMSLMFFFASAANPDVSAWDVSNVNNMLGLFSNAAAANPDVSGWDVSNVTEMQIMFQGASTANPDVSEWDVSNVTYMVNMFYEAAAANPDVSQWNIGNVTVMANMFFDSGLSAENYTAALLNFAGQTTQSNVTLGLTEVTFCSNQGVEEAKATLIGRGWTITDEGPINCN